MNVLVHRGQAQVLLLVLAGMLQPTLHAHTTMGLSLAADHAFVPVSTPTPRFEIAPRHWAHPYISLLSSLVSTASVSVCAVCTIERVQSVPSP